MTEEEELDASRAAQVEAERKELGRARMYAEVKEMHHHTFAQRAVEVLLCEAGLDELDAYRLARKIMEVFEDFHGKATAFGYADMGTSALGGWRGKGHYKVEPERIQEEFKRLRATGLTAYSARAHIVENSVRLFEKTISLSTVKTHTR